MTDAEKALVKRWIIENVSDREVPGDEGNADALIYNLVHLLYEGRTYERYAYKAEQDAELREWGR